MRVAQVIDNLGPGGAQRLLVIFAQEAARRGVTVDVIALGETTATAYPAELEACGAGVHLVTADSRIAKLRELVGLLRRLEPDIIHTHLERADVLGLLAASRLARPAVATLHNVDVEPPSLKRSLLRIIHAWVLRRRADQIIAVGKAVAETQAGRLGATPTQVVRNPAVLAEGSMTDAEKRALRASVTGDPERPLLLAVGRLSPQKAYHHLIAAVAEVRRKVANVAVAIAGAGELQHDLQHQIDELDLADTCFILGQRIDVPELMQAADAFVNPALWEGLPMVVLEAMSASLPVVATPVGDVGDVVGETGLLVTPGDVGALADALTLIISDGDLRCRLGRETRARISGHLSPPVWFDELMRVYGEARAAHRIPGIVAGPGSTGA